MMHGHTYIKTVMTFYLVHKIDNVQMYVSTYD